MAFRGARFAAMMAKNTSATLAMKVALAGVILIPVIFAGFYLSAFLDPYAHLNQVPVAVVNNDEGATINGEDRNIGDEVVQRLKDQPEDESLGWSFVSEKEAKQGMKDGTYYMICTLPKDFSEQIASADTSDPEKANIVVNYDESANMLASQIGENAWKQLVSKVNQSVVEEYFGTVFDKITDAGDDLQEAVDGALELYDGLADAEEGSGKITTNLYKLVDGSDELKSGLQKLSDGTSTLAAGANQLKEGTSSLESSTQQLSDGAKSLSSGATTALAGASVLSAGSAQLDEGTQKALAGAQELSSGANELSTKVNNEVVPAIQNLSTGSSSLYAGLKELADKETGLPAAKSGADQVSAGASELVEKTEDLPETMQSALKALESGKTALESGASALNNSGLSSVSSSIKDAQDAMSDVSTPLTNASTQQSDAATAANEAKNSIEAAKNSVETVDSRSGEASSEVENASNKISDVADDVSSAKSSLQDVDVTKKTITKDDGSTEEVLVISSSDWEKVKSAKSKVSSAAGNASSAQKLASDAIDAANEAEKSADSATASVKTAESKVSDVATKAAASSENLTTANSKVSTATDKLASAKSTVDSVNKQVASQAGTATACATAVKQVRDGVESKSSDISALSTELQVLSAGASKVSEGLESAIASLGSDDNQKTLVGGANAVNSGLSSLNSNMPALTAGIEDLTNGAADLAGDEALGKLASGATSIHAGLQQLVGSSATDDSDASGLTALAEGAGTLSSGMSQLNEATPTLVDGISQLAAGSNKLASSAPSAVSGAGQIGSGASKLASGSSTLTDGLGTAKDGADELHDGLEDGVEQMSYTDKEKSDKKEQMSEPVELDEEYYTSVDNYGTGFAPFFIALGVWVGAIFNCFLFRSLNSRLGLSGANPFVNAIASYLPMVCFSIASTMIAQAFVQFGLGAQINNVVGYYGMGIITAMCFTAMVQFLVAAFGFPGRFIAVLILTLQMTSAAGTFPIVMEPDFFGIINPLFPMTYVVEGMRQLMTGVGTFPATQDVAIVACYAIVFFLLTVVVAWKKRHVTMADIHPLLDL